MSTDFRGLPGVYTGLSATPRNIFTSWLGNVVQFVPTMLTIDGTNSRDPGSSTTSLIRAGVIFGLVTATKKLRPSIIGLTSASAINTATSVTVPAAVATEVARLIANNGGSAVNLTFTGPPTAGGTVASQTKACSAASGTTLTVAALSAALAAGSAVQPADGSQTPVTIYTREYGVDVVARDGTSVDQPLHMYLRGADLIAANIVNLVADDFGNSADASTQAYFKTQLKNVGFYTFDNDRQ